MTQFHLSAERSAVDLLCVHGFLSQSYWAEGIALETVCKAVDHSLCFSGFVGTEQVAFGRAVTDFTTFAFLRDIFVLPEHRSKGYGKAIVQALMARLAAEGIPKVMLATSDAHGLYRQFGFEPIGHSPKLMGWQNENKNAAANSGA